MENEKATILWDHQVKTDRHIPCNKPDIIIQEKDSERCLIIGVAIPSDSNIQKKATDKIRATKIIIIIIIIYLTFKLTCVDIPILNVRCCVPYWNA